MSVSAVSICNRALGYLHAGPIASLDEDSEAARKCKTFYDDTRRELLRKHPWNFAIKRVTLALEATTPNHGFSYSHELPTDLLRLLEPSDLDLVHKIEGRSLLCDEQTVYVRYVSDVTDPGEFDAAFVDVLAVKLAAEIAYPLTLNSTHMERLEALFRDKVREAKGVDAMEGTPEVVDRSSWLEARR